MMVSLGEANAIEWDCLLTCKRIYLMEVCCSPELMRKRPSHPPPDRDARRQKTHSPPSHTHPRSRSRTPAKDCVEDEWNGIIAFLKQLPDGPFDAADWRDGARAKCNVCGRMKTKLGFSGNQQRYGTMRRCRI